MTVSAAQCALSCAKGLGRRVDAVHRSRTELVRSFSIHIRGTIPVNGHGLVVGQYAEVDRIFTEQDVETFGNLINDHNLLHSSLNWEKALSQNPSLGANKDAGLIRLKEDGIRTKPVVHGMLVSSLFSSIFGTLVPGCVYMNQSLDFRAAVHVEDTLIGRLEIEKIRRWRRGGVVVECYTQVLCDENVVVKGTANVWLPSGYKTES